MRIGCLSADCNEYSRAYAGNYQSGPVPCIQSVHWQHILHICRSIAHSLDPQLLKAWFHTITTMRTELANWTARQSKHAAVAYPLITYLICMEENNTFSQYVDTLVDNLHRQLKVDHHLHCLHLPVSACAL